MCITEMAKYFDQNVIILVSTEFTEFRWNLTESDFHIQNEIWLPRSPYMQADKQ
jgi:hypothetical protein